MIMLIPKYKIKQLTNEELIEEWEGRGYEEYRNKVGKVAGLGWDTMDAATNYANYYEEMCRRDLL